jgi:hypothetical protein
LELQNQVGNRAVTMAIQGAGVPALLPHRVEFQRSFGVDFADVKVRVDAQEELTRIGAEAATHDDTVVFADSNPDRRTVAHELAHVVQNRKASTAAAEGVSHPNAAAETEARDASERASRGESAEVSAAPAASVQLLPRALTKMMNRVQGRTNYLEDEDVDQYTKGEGGTLNTVDQVKYNTEFGGGRRGFFKKYDVSDAPSENAVASSRLARALKMDNVIARNKFAKHHGALGAVSSAVAGKPLFEGEFNADFDMAAKLRLVDPNMAPGSDSYKLAAADIAKGSQLKSSTSPTGQQQWKARNASVFQDVNFKDPRIQKGLADLQLFDSITGQRDRHGGNIYVDQQSGGVRGIDDDLAFNEGGMGTDVHHPHQKNLGLPSQVDKSTANKVLKLKAKNLSKILFRAGDPDMDEQQRARMLEEAKGRLEAVQEHVRGLKKNKQLVNKWDTNTYDAAMGEGDRTDRWGEKGGRYEASYLKRSVNNLEKARQGYTNADGVQYRVGGAPAPALAPASAPSADADVARRERMQRRKGIDLTQVAEAGRRARWARRKFREEGPAPV